MYLSEYTGDGNSAETAVAPQGHDRGDDCGQPAADHVERSHGRGSDAAAGHASDRRHGQQFDPHFDRDARDLRVAARAGIAAGIEAETGIGRSSRGIG